MSASAGGWELDLGGRANGRGCASRRLGRRRRGRGARLIGSGMMRVWREEVGFVVWLFGGGRGF